MIRSIKLEEGRFMVQSRTFFRKGIQIGVFAAIMMSQFFVPNQAAARPHMRDEFSRAALAISGVVCDINYFPQFSDACLNEGIWSQSSFINNPDDYFLGSFTACYLFESFFRGITARFHRVNLPISPVGVQTMNQINQSICNNPAFRIQNAKDDGRSLRTAIQMILDLPYLGDTISNKLIDRGYEGKVRWRVQRPHRDEYRHQDHYEPHYRRHFDPPYVPRW